MRTKDTDDVLVRTHAPSLRELTGDFDGAKELLLDKLNSLKELINERDDRYKERYESQKTEVAAALAAQKEQTKASFDASEKAIVKAEESQKTYNQGHNDLSRKMELQYATMVPQAEAQLKWNSVDKAIEEIRKEQGSSKTAEQNDIGGLRIELMKEISNLRESRSGNEGRSKGATELWGYLFGLLGIAVAIATLVVSWAAAH